MLNFSNLRKLGINTTILATSISLVACGGGGGGYYGEDDNNTENNSGNNSTSDTSKVVESLSVQLQDAAGLAIQQAHDSSVVQIAVKVLNNDKGGISGKSVRLSIADAEQLGVTSKASLVTTGDNGFAVFELNIPALQAASGKVQLTAHIDGTTIKQSYTLNIKKSSTIQSDYKLNIDQGVVLNLPKGNATVNARVTDSNGGVKADQSVTLTLPSEMQNKFIITSGSTLRTDSTGIASFTIQANSDLTEAEITQFVAKSQTLNFKLVDDKKAEESAEAAITFKELPQIVQKLEIVTEDAPLIAQNGTTKVKVLAKNSNGDVLANRKVKLTFTDSSLAYQVSIVQSEVTTDANGIAIFTVNSNSSHPIALSQQGVNLKASYVDNNISVFANSTIKVITADVTASNQEAIQRLEIGASYKVNAKGDKVTIIVKGVNNKGLAATQGKVKLTLNSEAVANGVTFVGSAEQEFKTGTVEYTLSTNALTVGAVEALVNADILATFTTDNNVTNSIKIEVENEEKSEDTVNYLAIDPISSTFDYTKDQKIQVKVKAVGKSGGVVVGEKIKLAFSKSYSAMDLQKLGLSLTGQAEKTTDENGYVTFDYQYKADASEIQRILVANGIGITASAVNGVGETSIAMINFKAPTAQGAIDLDYLTVDMPGALTVSASEQTINVAVKAFGSDGKVFANQAIGIGLNDTALSNGVSLASASGLTTDANGNVNFQLKVLGKNSTEIANLIANGITIALKSNRKDGSSYTLTRKIIVAQPVVVVPDLAGLDISTDNTTVSVLGGEVRVKVIAKDSSGKIIANTPIAIALSSLVGPRVSLSDTALTTNSKGEAEFTIRVAEDAYDANLIKNGITFAVVGTSLSNGDRIQQTSTVQVVVPTNALNPRLTAETNVLKSNDQIKIYAAVKDEAGAYTAGTPMRLALNPEAVAAGVTLSTDNVLVTDSGNVAIDLKVPKGLSTSQLANVFVTGSINNPNGSEIKTTLKFEVQDVVNEYHLSIDRSRASLSLAGDTALVTVKLLDANQGGVTNQPVSLALLDSRNGTTIRGASEVITNEYGDAIFTLDMKASNSLDFSDIQLVATHTNAQGAKVHQISDIGVHTPTALAPQLDLKLKASKDKLHVRGDAVDVSVLVTDINGSSQSAKAVTLSIPNYQNNGAYIRGASTLTSDENGWVKFTVVVDESLRAEAYDAAEFVSENLEIEAVVKDANATERRQSYLIDVINADIPVTQGSITVVMNPTGVGVTDPTNVYYNWNASVQLVDLDGRPVSNQNVTMNVRAVEFKRGAWTVFEDPLTTEKSWIQYLPALALLPPLSCAIPSVNDALTPYDDRNETITGEKDRDGNPVLETLNVVSFIGADESNPYTATYRTDKEGRFDFELRYPKAYAGWLKVQVGATTSLSLSPVHGYRTVMLPAVNSDFDKSEWSYTPSINNQSPYGIIDRCK